MTPPPPQLACEPAGRARGASSHPGAALFSLLPMRKGSAVKNFKKVTAIAAGLGVAATLIAMAPTAQAHTEEPAPAGTFVAVGSDTLESVVAALADGTHVTGAYVRSTANGTPFASFNATNATGVVDNIVLKAGGPTLKRPNGSGNGVLALSRSIDGAAYNGVTITGQVDIARSSSAPAGNMIDNNAGELAYVPFARDALTYAYKGSDAKLANLDDATLKLIYQCDATTLAALKDGANDLIPVLPQNGSGSRKDFLKAIGLTEGQQGSCVRYGQEHDTRTIDKLPAGTGTEAFPANAITPISAAQWVSQNTGAAEDRRGAGVKLGSPLAGVPAVNGTGATAEPNAAYYANNKWGRDTFLVAEYARVVPGVDGAKYDAKLANLLGFTGSKLSSAQSVLPSQAGAVKKKFGFLAPSSSDVQRVKKTA